MTNFKKACMLATACVMLAPAAVLASSHANDVVKDMRGNVIMNTFGNCVETKWEASTNECLGATVYSRISKEQRTVYFDFNKSTLNAREKSKLDALAKTIAASKEVEHVDIVGYADMIGTSSYNQQLSMRRANTVKSYLASRGLKTRKARVEAMGDKAPVTQCDSNLPREELIACLAADRRVEVELNVRK